MAENTYTMFDEAAGCNQQVPVNDIVEHVALGRIYPVHADNGLPAVMPLGVASPVIAGYAAAMHSSPFSEEKPPTPHPLLSSWGKVKVERWTPPKEILVADAQPDSVAPAGAVVRRVIGAGKSRYVDIASAQDWLASLQFPMAVYVPYKQDWALQGYSRGMLVNSFALAPQEELTLETYTWDRTKTSKETDFSLESEALTELTQTAKSSFEAVLEARKNEHWTLDVHAGLNLPPSTPISASGNFGAGGSLDTTNKQTVSYINEAVSKASNRIKSTRQVKISEAQEIGREGRSKRVIRNPNMCHTLHFDYFEILENYLVTTMSDLANAKLCVLVEIPEVESITNALGLVTYEGFLRGKVPASLDAAFDSARKLVAYDRFCTYKCQSKCICAPTATAAASQGATVLDPVTLMQDAAGRFIDSVSAIRVAGLGTLEDTIVNNAKSVLDSSLKPTEEEWSNAYQAAWRAAFKIVAMEFFAPRFWSACEDFADRFKAGRSTMVSADVDALIASAEVQAIDVLNAVNAMNLLVLKAPITLAGLTATYPLAVGWLALNLAFDSAGMDIAFTQLKNALAQVKADEAAAAAAAAAGKAKTTDGTPAAADTQDDAVAQGLAEASVAVDALVGFIRLNASHYKLLIWNSLEEVDQIRLLTASMATAEKHLLPNILGMIGDKVAVEFNLAADLEAAKWLKSYLNGSIVSETKSITLPSPGISMQTRLGQCDACEPFIEDSRTIELQRLQAVADQQSSEADRMKKRVQAKDYSDPLARIPSIAVSLDKSTDKPA